MNDSISSFIGELNKSKKFEGGGDLKIIGLKFQKRKNLPFDVFMIKISFSALKVSSLFLKHLQALHFVRLSLYLICLK